MAQYPGTNRQVPDHAIMDFYNKQVYLGNQYIFASNSQVIAAAAETPLFLVRNPAVTTASFPANYESLFIVWKRIICGTAAQSAILRLYLNPTVTAAGTAQTPLNMRPASLVNQPSISAFTTAPTVSSNGTFLQSLSSSAFNPDQSQLMTILDPGQVLYVTVQPTAVSTAISAELSWYEI